MNWGILLWFRGRLGLGLLLLRLAFLEKASLAREEMLLQTQDELLELCLSVAEKVVRGGTDRRYQLSKHVLNLLLQGPVAPDLVIKHIPDVVHLRLRQPPAGPDIPGPHQHARGPVPAHQGGSHGGR